MDYNSPPHVHVSFQLAGYINFLSANLASCPYSAAQRTSFFPLSDLDRLVPTTAAWQVLEQNRLITCAHKKIIRLQSKCAHTLMVIKRL